MNQTKICQSCGLPFDEHHRRFLAIEPDGSDSLYCIYCFADGKFKNPDMTLEEAIEMGVPHLARKISVEKAREELSALLPKLKRWRGKK